MNDIEFGLYLKNIRKQKKLTVRQLDLYSGVSHSYISQLERGVKGIPSPDILKKLSKPLGVDYEELMRVSGYIKEETETMKLLNKLITNLLAGTEYDKNIANNLTLEEKIEILITLTESSGNMSIDKSEEGIREIRFGSNSVEITDPDSIDQLNLSYEGMGLTRGEKLEFLAIAKAIFSARQGLKGKA